MDQARRRGRVPGAVAPRIDIPSPGHFQAGFYNLWYNASTLKGGDNITKIYVCDSMMGTGKTSAAINMMNSTPGNYVFVTQFLSEVERVLKACKGFKQPSVSSTGKKIESIRRLFKGQKNIASTHALFYRYDDDILETVRQNHYTLVLDEVVDVLRFLNVSRSDIEVMLEAKLIAVDENGRVEWLDDNYSGTFNDIREEIRSSCVILSENKLMVWTLPTELFLAFDTVYVLTYMFEAQYQYHYFIVNNIEFQYITVRKLKNGYKFTTNMEMAAKVPKPIVNIVEGERINAIGKKRTALSVTWYEHATEEDIERIKKNMLNLMKKKFRCGIQRFLWSVYLDFKEAVEDDRYKNGFLSFNARGMNNYGDRDHLAYLVNVFPPPEAVIYFAQQGTNLDIDKFALSVMVQWVWRSAIRNGKEIWLYVPSVRMRTLFAEWIQTLTD